MTPKLFAVKLIFMLKPSISLPKTWIFDIDETTLSNIQYYADTGFGVEPYNATKFGEWVYLGKAPALPESLKI
ncbi:hypothetical protein GYH30_017082 [Glycine max]|nr:hypothetical protein GYH30_017082 [Glycine max]